MEGLEVLHLEFDRSLRNKIGERLEKQNPQTVEELIVFANSIMARFSEIHPEDLPDTNSIHDYFDSIEEFKTSEGFDVSYFCNMIEEYYNERVDELFG